jgi:hypothetical protein
MCIRPPLLVNCDASGSVVHLLSPRGSGKLDLINTGTAAVACCNGCGRLRNG